MAESYTKGETWGALRNAWTGFKASRTEGDVAAMHHYARLVNDLQRQLGRKVTKFTNFSPKKGVKAYCAPRKRNGKSPSPKRKAIVKRRVSPKRQSPKRKSPKRGKRSPSPKLRRSLRLRSPKPQLRRR